MYLLGRILAIFWEKEDINMYYKKSKAELEICDLGYMLNNNETDISKQNILEEYTNNLSKKSNTTTHIISTNIVELDKMLGGGMRPGIYVIGANPGLGKTSLTLHLMLEFALQKQHVAFFNLEMSVMQIITKLLSNLSYRLSLKDADFPKFTINELSTLKELKKKNADEYFKKLLSKYINEINPYVNIISKSEDVDLKNVEGESSNYVEKIGIAIKNYQQWHKISPVIIVDFLQLLETKETKKFDKELDKRKEMDIIIDKLKKYSNIYQVSIILISSLSRRSYTKTENEEENFEYDLAIFKETGSIEYTADFIALLTQSTSDFSFADEESKLININILKSRYSPYVGNKVTMKFLPEYSYFEMSDEN